MHKLFVCSHHAHHVQARSAMSERRQPHGIVSTAGCLLMPTLPEREAARCSWKIERTIFRCDKAFVFFFIRLYPCQPAWLLVVLGIYCVHVHAFVYVCICVCVSFLTVARAILTFEFCVTSSLRLLHFIRV